MTVAMTSALPLVLIPGLAVTARLYTDQIPVLWRSGPVLVADHTRHASLSEIARAILDTAPPRFALAGLSMGGYIAFEIMRQAPERVLGLALLHTTARPEQPEQSAARHELIALARAGKLEEIADRLFLRFVSRAHQSDVRLRQLVRRMAVETGAAAFERQERAILGRLDSRPHLAAIRCPTVVLVGDGDELTPPPLAREIAAGIPGSRLHIIADSGHLSTLEQPEQVSAVLLEWLESVRG
jgi:pimeloyl-ACP methyl ester carboxylesterase